jgi:hypothetical protein
MTSARPIVGVFMAGLVSVGIVSCGKGAATIASSTSCDGYLKRDADTRHVAASRIAVQYGQQGNPMWGLTVDGACATDPSMTLGELFSQRANTPQPSGVSTGTSPVITDTTPTAPETTTTTDPALSIAEAARTQLTDLLTPHKPCWDNGQDVPIDCPASTWAPFAAAAKTVLDQMRAAGAKEPDGNSLVPVGIYDGAVAPNSIVPIGPLGLGRSALQPGRRTRRRI